MNKKYVLTISFIIVLTLVFIFYFKNKGPTNSVQALPSPNFPNYYNSKLPIEDKINKSGFTFPNYLPTYSYSVKKIDKNSINEIAKSLKIDNTIEEFNDIETGLKYFTNTDKYFFVVTPKTGIIKYGNSSGIFPIVANKNLSDIEIKTLANNFISRSKIYSNKEFKDVGIKYLARDEITEGLTETTREKAEVVQIDYTFSNLNYKIVNTESAESIFFVQILMNGDVYNMQIPYFEIKDNKDTYAVKSYDDIVFNLNQSKLINFSGDYISANEIKSSEIKKIDAQKIEIAYLIEDNKNVLQPIFIISGNANVLDTSINSASLYLPAFK